ncbi:MAG: APC family permease [Gammaproteobacteria bacterium]
MTEVVTLARRVSLPLLTFYGVGTILGAGIYVLIGEVTLRAGDFAPFSFFVAATVAAITAYSFARLSSRFPKSAGEAAYVSAAFDSPKFAALIGLAVVIVGSVSSAVLVRGFAGYLIDLTPLPELLVISVTLVVITLIAVWGIGESLIIASVITLAEIAGLLFVIYVVIDPKVQQIIELPSMSAVFDQRLPIFFGAFICFYAFIGFEDIVNLAEETVNPRRVLPLAISASIVISTTLYIALSISSIAFVPKDEFMHSSAPIVAIVKYKGYSPYLMGVLSMVAIINGALIQIIMASRVLYGMGKQNLFFPVFGRVNRYTRTPVIGTLTIAAFIYLLAAKLPLVTLASATSAITLAIFVCVQASLLVIAVRERSPAKLDFVMPVLGIIMNVTLLSFGYFR